MLTTACASANKPSRGPLSGRTWRPGSIDGNTKRFSSHFAMASLSCGRPCVAGYFATSGACSCKSAPSRVGSSPPRGLPAAGCGLRAAGCGLRAASSWEQQGCQSLPEQACHSEPGPSERPARQCPSYGGATPAGHGARGHPRRRRLLLRAGRGESQPSAARQAAGCDSEVPVRDDELRGPRARRRQDDGPEGRAGHVPGAAASLRRGSHALSHRLQADLGGAR